MKKLILVVSTFSIIGCLTDLGDPVGDVNFGASYDLVVNSEFPKLRGDSLIARVAYSGCSNNHQFLFRYRTVGLSRAEVWFFKDNREEVCLAYFEEVQTVALPVEIMTKQNIVLLGPLSKVVTLR